jgi:hypothetical protein
MSVQLANTYIVMLLYHHTTYANFLDILKEGKIRPASKTGKKEENPNDIDSPYNFFNVLPNRRIKEFCGRPGVGVAFDVSVLKDAVFYTNRNHSAGNTRSSRRYKGNIDVLYNLYRQSKQVLDKVNSERGKKDQLPFWVLSVYQEVFTRKAISIKDIKYITVNEPKHGIPTVIRHKYELIYEEGTSKLFTRLP